MRTIFSKKLLQFFLITEMLTFYSMSMAEIYTVTNLENDGPGSLREAIIQANKDVSSEIIFTVNGNIQLQNPLPTIRKKVKIDGSTAPGFVDKPVVSIDFSNFQGFIFKHDAADSIIQSLSLIHASNAAITLKVPRVTIAGNYIGLDLNGAVAPNQGDGIYVTHASKKNLIGRFNPVVSQNFYSQIVVPSISLPNNSITDWKGIRILESTPTDYLISGTSAENGLLYIGTIDGTTGSSYLARFPNSNSTIAYGPNDTGTSNNFGDEILQLVGSYTLANDFDGISHGFLWTGTVADLPFGGVWETIDYPKFTHQATHSVMGSLAVGNAFNPNGKKAHPRKSVAYIYDVNSKIFIDRILFPQSKHTFVSGIWRNNNAQYTICGNFSSGGIRKGHHCHPCKKLDKHDRMQAFLVDFNVITGEFANWKAFEYPYGTKREKFATDFTGISSPEPGVYTLSANAIPIDEQGRRMSQEIRGSLVTIRRNNDASFGVDFWEEIQNPSPMGDLIANSAYGNKIVGQFLSEGVNLPYQAVINLGFQLSNVISGNLGNGIRLSGSHKNIVAMNYIGTDPQGSIDDSFGNGKNGILITKNSCYNLIGGQAASDNNPTGDKGSIPPTFIRPPQGNLISGNYFDGVHINKKSSYNILSSNYIGTDAQGAQALGNRRNGVRIEKANNNSLIGCLVNQHPFVFYNVISGNAEDGIYIKDAHNTAIQANFVGINPTNDGIVPNGGNGLLVAGKSKNTISGGIIPLGNVFSGNVLNGIAVVDEASDFISFNTFAGIFAFQLPPAPNGRNGILFTSTGKRNSVRTNIFSGNNWNGIEISGGASGVQIVDTACGLSTNFTSIIPNGRNGILIGGQSHHNVIGGFVPSIEVRNHIGGNLDFGICITDQAHDNRIINTDIGTARGLNHPNQKGGILLNQGTSFTTIGGLDPTFVNLINTNVGAGIWIIASKNNDIINNIIESNADFGIFAAGDCDETLIKRNIIFNNGNSFADNVQIDNSTGIQYIP